MAEQNKSQLISEAELIEAINADSIISVSLGAGQPQKNVKLSTLASVVAGLVGLNDFLKFRGDKTDCNTTDVGVYKCSSPANGPYSSDIGILVSLQGLASGVYMLQLYGSLLQQSLHYRFKVDASWTPWKQA